MRMLPASAMSRVRMRLQFLADYGIDTLMRWFVLLILSALLPAFGSADERTDCIVNSVDMLLFLDMNDNERATRVGQICRSYLLPELEEVCASAPPSSYSSCLDDSKASNQILIEVQALRMLATIRLEASKNPAEAG